MISLFNPADPNAGTDSLLSDEQIKERRRAARAAAAAAGKQRPMTHWAQALAQGLEGAVAGYELNQTDKAEKSSRDALAKGLEGLSIPGTTSSSTVPAAPTGTPAAAANVQSGSGDPKSALDAVMKFESGGRNIHQQAVPAGGGFNPSTGTVTGPSSAQGYFQMITPTWKRAAAMAGIDTSKFPTAMSASYEDQRKAASALFAAEGFKPWAPYNAALRAHIAKNGGAGAFVNDGPVTAQADMPAAGARPAEGGTGGQGFVIPEGQPAAPQQPVGSTRTPAEMRADAELYAQTNPEASRQFLAMAEAAEAEAAAAQPPAAAPMATENPPITATPQGEVPLNPAFMAEGASQPWMGTALAPQAAPAPQAPQMAQAPMPPARPADLDPRADMPAPGAVPAMAQALPAPQRIVMQPQADLSNESGAGARELQVQSEQARQGQPAGDVGMPQRLAAALGGGQPIQQQAGPSPQSLGAALGGGRSPGIPEAAVASGSNGAATDPRLRMAALLARSGRSDAAIALAAEATKQPSYGFQVVGDQLYRTDPRGGTVTPMGVQKKSLQMVDMGTDPQTGATIRGTFDPQTGETKRLEQPANPNAGPSAIPPVPPGVDPKVWRETQSKRASEEGLPASFDDTAKVRNEITQRPSYKNIAQAAPIYRAMVEAAGRDTKAADLNMVYGLGKIMDPGSVVREGEIVMANDTQGLADRLNGFIKSIQGEGRLRPEARAQIMAEAHGRVQSYVGEYKQDQDFYRGIATKNRMDPDQVIPSFGEFKPWEMPQKPAGTPDPARTTPAPAPKAGAVEDGFRFKGGNPGDPANWERVQ